MNNKQSKKNISKTKVMAFGTFEFFHKGHENFLKQARKLAKDVFLIVSIARDKNVKKIKGFYPYYNERQRLNNLKKSNIADKVALGSLSNYLAPILREKPEIIALGYDQKVFTKNLKNILAEKGLDVKVVRLKAFKPKVFKSSKIKLGLESSKVTNKKQ